MDLAVDFPHKYLLNLDRRRDRRERCERIFARLGWRVERHSAVDGRVLKAGRWRGFGAAGRYAHAVSMRMMLRRAGLAGAEAVLILEDDISVSPVLGELLAKLALPEGWGIFYLGCQHAERPEVVSRGVVRVRAALDTHAWAVRREYFLEVRRALRGKFWPKGEVLPPADMLLAELARRVPAYAVFPNLVWQEAGASDLTGGMSGNYDANGRQRLNRECLAGVTAEALWGTAYGPGVAEARSVRARFWPAGLRGDLSGSDVKEVGKARGLSAEGKVAFLFPTKGEHWHLKVWADYWRGQEERVTVYGCARDRSWPVREGDWLREGQIGAGAAGSGGSLTTVRAQMALLEAALAEERNAFFVFAGECTVPVRPLGDLLRLLGMDGRSRFRVETYDGVQKRDAQAGTRVVPWRDIPAGEWRFHSPWLLLNREAAELVAANAGLLECFAGTPDAEAWAVGTILQAAGYPMERRVAGQDVTCDGGERTGVDGELMGEIAASGCYFARGFAARSGVGRFRLHAGR